MYARTAAARAHEKQPAIAEPYHPAKNPLWLRWSGGDDARCSNLDRRAFAAQGAAKRRRNSFANPVAPCVTANLPPRQPESRTHAAKKARQKRPDQPQSHDRDDQCDNRVPKQEAESAENQGVSAEAQTNVGNRLRREVRDQSRSRLGGVGRQRRSAREESCNHFDTRIGLPEGKHGEQCATQRAG